MMYSMSDVNQVFDDIIDEIFPINKDVNKFLKRHERRVLLEQNVLKEIRKADNVVAMMKLSNEEKQRLIRSVMKDIMKIFVKAALDELEMKAKQRGSHGESSEESN